MARHIQIPGLASLLVVAAEREIDDLIDNPALERTFESAGPLLNRVILSGARRSVSHDGRVMLSFRPRGDEERQRGQRQLFHKLDALADARPWSPDAIAAIASYVVTGEGQNRALTALTYVTAYPFLNGGREGQPVAFDEALFARVHRRYRQLSTARRPLAGVLIRLAGADTRARRRILELTGGDDYGLHAIAITLDNSQAILEHLRALAKQQRAAGKGTAVALEWAAVRTAPALVLRQVKEAATVPHTDARTPAGTLVLLRMRQGLAEDTRTGYEFASDHWSACPARRYVMAVFTAVCEATGAVPGKAAP